MDRKEDEERKRRRDAKYCRSIRHFFVKKAVLTQNTGSSDSCSESLFLKMIQSVMEY